MSIQNKGQFYVRNVEGGEGYCPIDNFIFKTDDELEVRIDSCGDRALIFVNISGGRYKYYDDRAEQMRALADILDGTTTLEDIVNWNWPT